MTGPLLYSAYVSEPRVSASLTPQETRPLLSVSVTWPRIRPKSLIEALRLFSSWRHRYNLAGSYEARAPPSRCHFPTSVARVGVDKGMKQKAKQGWTLGHARTCLQKLASNALVC
jgi:hypothetical protein